MKRLNKFILVSLFLWVIHISTYGQEVENNYQYRTSFQASFKPFKKLKISLKPETRFDESFSMDEFIFDTELTFEPIKHLYFSANYRFIGNLRENKDTEYLNRYALSATLKNNFNRFTPAFRLRFSDYADDEVTDKTFLRYKASLKYDIAKVKLTPIVAIEAFQELDKGQLFKLRYTAGADYKIFKNNYVGIKYKFDYYNQEYRNRHIFSLGYKIKF